jgi:DNA polymerase-3 subunit epsilon
VGEIGPPYQDLGRPSVPVQSPFELKDSLKRRGYRVNELAVESELAFLKAEIYLRDVEPRLQTLTAFTRFSCRI